MGRPKSGFSLLSDADLVAYCAEMYQRDGIKSLSFDALKKHRSLYFHLYNRGILQEHLLEKLGIAEEYNNYKNKRPINRNGKLTPRWTWERIVSQARAVQEQEASLPPAGWFQQNGHGSLVQAVYSLGRTWADVRTALGDFTGSSFVESRSGIRWLSHPEASMSNFLYARGLEHRRGERYPESFELQARQSRGFYDLHFKVGERWIDVEIWGENPGGHDSIGYQIRRDDKETFNTSNSDFLGVEFKDCFDEDRLAKILEPYIGVVVPFRFDRPTDELIHSTHWSNSDELLVFCRQLATEMPDGVLPGESWLRKRGKWADRPGPAYNTASIYIRLWLGGVRRARALLGQSDASTVLWDKEKAVAAWKMFFDKHSMTPSQYRSRAQKGKIEADSATLREAGRLCSAIQKYAGGADTVNKAVRVDAPRSRKWSEDRLLSEFKAALDRWQATPTQVLYGHKTGKRQLTDLDRRLLQQLVDTATRKFGGVKVVLERLDFSTPSRPRKPRRSA